MFRGLWWLMLQTLAGRGVSLAAQIVLGWLLLPEHFGAISVGLFATGVATIFSGAVDDVIIQRSRRITLWLRTSFVLSMVVAIGFAILLVALAPLASRLFQMPVLTGVLIVLALSVPLTTLAVVPMAVLRGELRFGELAAYGTVELVLTQVLTVALAYLGYGAYALAVPVTAAAGLRAGYFLWRAPPWQAAKRVRLRFRPLLRSTATVSSTRFFTMLTANGDYLIIGLMTTPETLGIYYFAYRIAVQPLSMLAVSITSVLLPALASMNSEPSRQVNASVAGYRALSLLIFPASVLQALVARPLLELAFGDKWEKSIPLVQVLSLGLAFEALLWIAGSHLSARRQFGRVHMFAGINAAGFYLSAAIGTYFGGALGTAIAITAFFAIISPAEFWWIFGSHTARRAVGPVFGRPLLWSGIAGGAAYAAQSLAAAASLGPLPLAAITVLAGGGVYVVLMRYAEADIWTEIVDRIRRRLPAGIAR